MSSEKFRQQLKQEAEKWQAEGLINTSIFQQLAERYQFQSLETRNQNRFVVVLFGLGAILLGLGIITLVAANWQGWSRNLRVVLLLSVFLAVNLVGFWGWSSQQPRWRRLGKGLLLLGALILGANLGLMSQMFHQSGAVYELYLVWGIGVLAMAYGLQFSWLAILAILLFGIGYWWGLPDFFSITARGTFFSLMPYIPLFSMVGFIPLAHLCQSKWVFFWGVIAVVSALEVTVLQELSSVFADSPLLAGGMIAGAISLPPLLLWGYDFGSRNTHFQLRTVTRPLSIFFLVGVCYWFSFHYVWVDFSLVRENNSKLNYAPSLLQILIFASLTLYSWWKLGQNSNAPWRLRFNSTLVAVTNLTTGLVTGVTVAGLTFPQSVLILTVIYNLILFFSSIALIRQGLNQSVRLNFWAGLSIITLQVISRMFEYQTGLIWKAVILLLCGLSILIAGFWFERYLHQTSLPSQRE